MTIDAAAISKQARGSIKLHNHPMAMLKSKYTSGAKLRTAAGMMSGFFFFVAVDGTRFETTVPPFVLQAAGTAPGLLH